MLFGLFKISGHSMEPTISPGQTIVVSSLQYLLAKPKINDIIAFNYNKQIFIKRITQKKNDNYLVRGDNQHDSMDSRKFGAIEEKDILGKVLLAI